MGLSEEIKAEGINGVKCRLGTAVPLCPVGSPEPSVGISLENSRSAFSTLHVGFLFMVCSFNTQNPSSISFHCCVGIFFLLFPRTAFLTLHLSEYFKVLIPVLGSHEGLCAQTVGTQPYAVSVPGVCQGPERVTAA